MLLTPDRIQAFLDDLAKISNKHGIALFDGGEGILLFEPGSNTQIVTPIQYGCNARHEIDCRQKDDTNKNVQSALDEHWQKLPIRAQNLTLQPDLLTWSFLRQGQSQNPKAHFDHIVQSLYLSHD